MKRENGFYWVKWAGKWEVSEWLGDWYISGCIGKQNDSFMQQIDERRIINPND